MKVRFYDFSKRRNSTKQPPATGYTEKEVYLKESTSIKNPSFVLSGTNFSWNYAYIPDWDRYYFVDDIISITRDTTQYDLTEDVLATNKSAIGSTVARIAFSSTGWNKDIADPRMSVSSTKILYSANSSATLFNNTGCYVMSVFNKVAGASNGLGSCYVFDAANMQKVKNWLGDDAVFQQLTNYFLGNPLDSIFNCIWVPFSIGANPGAGVGTIYIGNQDSGAYGISGYVMSGTGRVSHTVSITIPRRNTYNADFRDAEPYTSGQLYLPGIGNIDLNMSDWLQSSTINVTYVLEYATGDVGYFIKDSAGHVIQTANTNMAALCPLGQMTTNAAGAVASIGSGVGSLAAMAAASSTTGGVAAAGALLVSAANTALSFNKRAASIKGGYGGQMAAAETNIFYTGYYMDTEDIGASYVSQKGRPVAVTHAISNHSGYVQCDDASVSLGGESWERDEVNSYLNGGFFYE